MNIDATEKVTEKNGPRPAGKPGECFYCRAPLGNDHAKDCVCRKKTVVLEYKWTVVVDVPQHWTAHDIEFHRNDGSWCADNAIDELHRRFCGDGDNKPCSCPSFKAKYLRDATVRDHQELGNPPIEEL